MVHEVGFASKDTIPGISFEGKYGADITQGFIGGGESRRQARSVVQARMGNDAVYGRQRNHLGSNDMRETTTTKNRNRFDHVAGLIITTDRHLACQNACYSRSRMPPSNNVSPVFCIIYWDGR